MLPVTRTILSCCQSQQLYSFASSHNNCTAMLPVTITILICCQSQQLYCHAASHKKYTDMLPVTTTILICCQSQQLYCHAASHNNSQWFCLVLLANLNRFGGVKVQTKGYSYTKTKTCSETICF